MNQCSEISTFLQQGTIVRNAYGKLCWPDGSVIFRERDDSIVQAINKALKRTNILRAEYKHMDSGETYEYLGTTREDSDASSDEQEDLGWAPGEIADCYAIGADRNPRFSKDARRQVQANPPNGPQGVKKLPERRDAVGDRRQGPPIRHSTNLDSHQPGLPKRLTPIRVDQHKFEGKVDHQFLPMDIDQGSQEKLPHSSPQAFTNQPGTNLPKTSNPGSIQEQISSSLVQEVLGKSITIPLAPLLEVAPPVRRELLNALKGVRGVSHQGMEKKEKTEKDEKKAFGSNATSFPPLLDPDAPEFRAVQEKVPLETRDDLLTIPVRIGHARMTGVFDSGSQVNIMSEQFAKICGLPIQTENLDRFRISGINGRLAECVGVIPRASILVTDSELGTIGEPVIVVRDTGFDLLLGRPWGTRNGAGIHEEVDGTYLNFNSTDGRYELNVSPSWSYRKKMRNSGHVVYAR